MSGPSDLGSCPKGGHLAKRTLNLFHWIIKFRKIIGCKYITNSLLNDVGILESFDQLLTHCSLKRFVSIHEDTNAELTTEFYTTLEVNAKNS